MNVHPVWQTEVYVQDSVAPDDHAGLKRCKAEMDRLNSLPDTINKEPAAVWNQSGRNL